MKPAALSDQSGRISGIARQCAIALVFGGGVLTSVATSPTECTSDADCEPRCEADADLIRAQTQSPIQEVTSRCDVPSRSCDCLDGETPVFSLSASSRDCSLRSDRTTRCLMEPAEVPECAEDAECQDVCELAVARTIDDLSRFVAVGVTRAACSWSCTCEFEIDGLCGQTIPRWATDIRVSPCDQ